MRLQEDLGEQGSEKMMGGFQVEASEPGEEDGEHFCSVFFTWPVAEIVAEAVGLDAAVSW